MAWRSFLYWLAGALVVMALIGLAGGIIVVRTNPLRGTIEDGYGAYR